MSNELQDELEEISFQAELLKRQSDDRAKAGVKYALEMAKEAARLHGATEEQIEQAMERLPKPPKNIEGHHRVRYS